jgi:hypothetical protein
MWQAVLDMMSRKDHLKEGAIEVILQIRDLQRYTRTFVHPSIKDIIMHLPLGTGSLRGSDPI